MITTIPATIDTAVFEGRTPKFRSVAFAEACIGRTQVERKGITYELRAVVQIVPLAANPTCPTITDLPEPESDFACELGSTMVKRLFQSGKATRIEF